MNKSKINKIVRDTAGYLLDLKAHSPVTRKKLSNKNERYVISFLIEQIANECVNLGNHVISSFDLELPETNKQIFKILADAKFISSAVATKMMKLVEIRNIIAHRYVKLSFAELARVANQIGVVERFIDEILAVVKKST